MFDSGNDKLNEALKQLVNIRACKEKLQGKLIKAQGTLTKMTTKHSNKPAGPSAKRFKHK
jgi:exonuclease VII small subunit